MKSLLSALSASALSTSALTAFLSTVTLDLYELTRTTRLSLTVALGPGTASATLAAGLALSGALGSFRRRLTRAASTTASGLLTLSATAVLLSPFFTGRDDEFRTLHATMGTAVAADELGERT